MKEVIIEEILRKKIKIDRDTNKEAIDIATTLYMNSHEKALLDWDDVQERSIYIEGDKENAISI